MRAKVTGGSQDGAILVKSVDRVFRGLTLLELIVGIAIVAILMALMLPAVQQCREAARNMACRNHLRQIGVAAYLHEGLYRHFPSGGWGWRWHGDPDRGFGKTQPGGWVYNMLPFIEQSPLRDMGSGLVAGAKAKALADSAAIPVAVFVCPTRRGPQAHSFVHSVDYINMARPKLVARSDYAACSGDRAPEVVRGKGRGPRSLAEGDSASYPWLDSDLRGVVFRRSMMKFADVLDGLSNTYLAGEKYLARADYFSGTGQNDDQHMLVGFDSDTLRTTDPEYPALADHAQAASDHSFGSAHPSAFNMAMADGSVQSVDYAVDREVHRARGTRHDRGAGQHR